MNENSDHTIAAVIARADLRFKQDSTRREFYTLEERVLSAGKTLCIAKRQTKEGNVQEVTIGEGERGHCNMT